MNRSGGLFTILLFFFVASGCAGSGSGGVKTSHVNFKADKYFKETKPPAHPHSKISNGNAYYYYITYIMNKKF